MRSSEKPLKCAVLCAVLCGAVLEVGEPWFVIVLAGSLTDCIEGALD